MKDSPFRLAPLGDCGSFHCGEEALDRYLQTQATQDIRRRIVNCFVAVEAWDQSTGRLLHDRCGEHPVGRTATR